MESTTIEQHNCPICGMPMYLQTTFVEYKSPYVTYPYKTAVSSFEMVRVWICPNVACGKSEE